MNLRVLLVLVFLPSLGAASGHDPAFGHWLSGNGKAIVQIEACGDKACGRIVWLAEPTGKGGAPKLDVRNERELLRDRPLCGLPMVGEFRQDAPGVWKQGYIYNPEDGRTYSAKMELEDAQHLHVRGYVGMPMLGKSQTWTRAAGDRGGC